MAKTRSRRRRSSSRRFSAIPRNFRRRRRSGGGRSLGFLSRFVPAGSIYAAGGAVAGSILPDFVVSKLNKNGTMSDGMKIMVRLGIAAGAAYAAKRFLRSNAAALGVLAGAAAREAVPIVKQKLQLQGLGEVQEFGTGDTSPTFAPRIAV